MSSAHYRITHDPAVRNHLRHIEAKHHRLILEAIEEQLRHEPLVETRNRFPVRPPVPWGEGVWKLRFGPNNCFRAFYTVRQEARLSHLCSL